MKDLVTFFVHLHRGELNAAQGEPGAVALDHRDLPRHPRALLHQHGVEELGDVRRGEGEHLLDLGTPVRAEPQVPAVNFLGEEQQHLKESRDGGGAPGELRHQLGQGVGPFRHQQDQVCHSQAKLCHYHLKIFCIIGMS